MTTRRIGTNVPAEERSSSPRLRSRHLDVIRCPELSRSSGAVPRSQADRSIDRVGIARGQPVEEALFLGGANAVDVPGIEFEHGEVPSDRRPQTVDRVTILFVGRLQARKRVDSLLRACAEIETKPRLLIIGDGPEREALETLAKEIYPSAEFIGAKHGAELKPYFQQADLFVLPGTGGLAVQEAMSYGLPVIVAKGDGTQDDLVREKNGWQIEPENYEALVSTMKNALSDIARLREMGKESFRIVSEEINIEKMADTFVNALNSL